MATAMYVRRESTQTERGSLFEQGREVGKSLIAQGQSYRDNWKHYDKVWWQAHKAGDAALMAYYSGVMRGLEIARAEINS